MSFIPQTTLNLEFKNDKGAAAREATAEGGAPHARPLGNIVWTSVLAQNNVRVRNVRNVRNMFGPRLFGSFCQKSVNI